MESIINFCNYCDEDTDLEILSRGHSALRIIATIKGVRDSHYHAHLNEMAKRVVENNIGTIVEIKSH